MSGSSPRVNIAFTCLLNCLRSLSSTASVSARTVRLPTLPSSPPGDSSSRDAMYLPCQNRLRVALIARSVRACHCSGVNVSKSVRICLSGAMPSPW